MEAGWLKAAERGDALVLVAGGAWDASHVRALDAELVGLPVDRRRRLEFEIGQVVRIDTAGAWLIHRTLGQWRRAGGDAAVHDASPEATTLLAQIAAIDRPAPAHPRPLGSLTLVLVHLGSGFLDVLEECRATLGFLGHLGAVLLRLLLRPRRIRLTSLVHHLEQVGLNALPIVGLISFLVGVVLAYQGAVQLQRFGAEIFVVNLIGVSVLREIGILLTAIVVAGRSGSAFAASIGSMKLHEEVDAMRTLGLDPMETLVVPRVLALVLAMPLLCFFADLMGLLGGGVMAWLALGIGPGVFIERLHDAVQLWSFLVGMIKAPVFGFVIAMIGCMEGLRVAGSAESVGRQTTRAVVASIFLVIVLNAVFSIFFSLVGV